jgi:hypothetical protein
MEREPDWEVLGSNPSVGSNFPFPRHESAAAHRYLAVARARIASIDSFATVVPK